MKRIVICLLLLALLLPLAVSAAPAEDPAVTAAKQYSYEVVPLLAPFNRLLLLKTENPDVSGLRLYDGESVYDETGDGYSAFLPVTALYADVQYEDPDTMRVHGGYLFKVDTWSDYWSDGGPLTVQVTTGSSYSPVWNDIAVCKCPPLENYTDYLIDEYTDPSKSLFENLDAVESALDDLAIYPFTLLDSDQPNEERPYPLFATSPYPELALNDHYETMFASHSGGMLTYALYPFILDSASYPNTMAAIARMLEPECTVKSGLYHWLIDVTLNGETKSYGSAGKGGRNPAFTKSILNKFRFDGSADDLYRTCTITSLGDLLMEIKADADAENARYQAMLHGASVLEAIGPGGWIRCGVEGLGFGTTFSYLVPNYTGNDGVPVTDAWVDGRYVNKNERIQPGDKFADHPKASIVVRGMKYTDVKGNEVVSDVVFDYDTSKDAWTAPFYYVRNYYYSSNIVLPDEMVITREEAEAMELDRNTDHLPSDCFLYDGTDVPGTPFTVVQVTGVEVPEKITLIKGDPTVAVGQVLPENAYDSRISWTFDRDGVAGVSYDGTLYAIAEGTVKGTARTVDGSYTAECEITVVVFHGWTERDGKTYYYDEDGYKLKGWRTIDGAQYYFDKDTGERYEGGVFEINGYKYSFGKDGKQNYLFGLLGDPSGDGKINAADYMMTKRTCLRTFSPDYYTRNRMDVDGNGEINSADYVAIKRHTMRTYVIEQP